ncbi:MAG TPA: NERD domain-containing protein [Gaiellaceae bacterium]|nr:NERD domain-containing protein [Gaiellaceae bacterium]
MKREWRDWAMLGGLIVVFSAGVIFFDGWSRVAWALVLGMLLATLIVFWLIGGDITSLTWVRGAVGERQTEEALGELPGGWRVFHDLPDGRGNLDHVAIGPGGVFAIDTKTYSASAKVENDVLRSGGIHTPGVAFRGSAVRLKETLERETGVTTWVQAVVAIWGEFPQGHVEEQQVVYIEADRLRGWLESRDAQLSRDRHYRLVTALEILDRR